MDQIHIKDLRIYANHGVYEEEKKLGQIFIVTIHIQLDLKKAASNDNIESSVNYAELCHLVEEIVTKEQFDLIETVALKVTEGILDQYPTVKKVQTLIKKPWAPIKMHLDTVEISIERSRHQAYIGLGSNMGDKRGNLDKAIEAIKKIKGTSVEKISQYIMTKPWGYTQQEDFCNAVVVITTYLEPQELLEQLLDIERQLKRVRERVWGPRVIDLDLLFYGQQVIYEENLIVPHPYVHKREFVLQSMEEVAPHWLHPVYHKTMEELLAEVRTEKDGMSV